MKKAVCRWCGIEFSCKSLKARYCCKYHNHLAYRKRNKEKVNERKNTWYANKEKRREYRKTMSDYHRKYWKERRKRDPIFRIKNNLRNRLNSIIKGKRSSLTKLLGCTEEEFKKHLETQFQSGMSWDNYGVGGWHIDHIKPLALFDLSDSKQIKLACHYTNLQPLWETDNLKKGRNYDF